MTQFNAVKLHIQRMSFYRVNSYVKKEINHPFHTNISCALMTYDVFFSRILFKVKENSIKENVCYITQILHKSFKVVYM